MLYIHKTPPPLCILTETYHRMLLFYVVLKYILPLYMLATSEFIVNSFASENQLFIRVIENKKKTLYLLL